MFRAEGQVVSRNLTSASRNKSAYNYWANPDVSVLLYDWSLILNDWENRILYLFFIPAISIKADELIARADQPHKIDLQIMYNDKTFTDTRSGYSFLKYLKSTLTY